MTIENGTTVKLLHSGYDRCVVVEYRGPLGPKGVNIYKILVSRKPNTYIEVREDQLEIITVQK